MADNFWYKAPPGYEQPPSYEQMMGQAAVQVFLDRIQNTVDAECNGTSQDSIETKRLRNFLLYCLAVDYRFSCSLSIPAEDREHFLELSKILQDMRTRHGYGPHMEAGDRMAFAPYLWKYLHEPCTSLAIPVESAVGIVVRYAKFLNFYGRYKGCIHGVLHNCGIGMLAQKMSTDRSILIPRLVTSEQTRRELTEKVTEIARPYFTSIGGATSEISVTSRPGRFEEEMRFHYTLTTRGKMYEENRTDALSTIKRSAIHLLDGVLGRVLDIKERRGQVFARGSTEEIRNSKSILPVPAPTDSAIWSSPPRWRDHESVFLPEMFESRTGQGYCDT